MCKPKSIKIPKRFIVDLSKLNPQQRNQYFMILSWSKRRARRYAYLVTHPDYLLVSHTNTSIRGSNCCQSIVSA